MPRHEAREHAQQLEVLCWVTIVLPTIAVALRLWSRLLRTPDTRGVCMKVGLWWDDWLAVGCLPFIYAHNGMMIRWARVGVPDSLGNLPDANMIEGLKLFYVANFIWNASNSLSRLAAIFLYARVFTLNNKKFKLAVKIAIGLVGLRAIIGIVGLGLICIPASRAWDLNKAAACGTTGGKGLVIAGESTYVFIDVVVLLLPLSIIWKLKLNLRQKAWIAAAMAYGYCVPIITIGTLVSYARANGSMEEVIYWHNLTLLTWMLLGAPVAVCCICLPTIFFLVKRRFKPLARTSSPPVGPIDQSDHDSTRALRSTDSEKSLDFCDTVKSDSKSTRLVISSPINPRDKDGNPMGQAPPKHPRSNTSSIHDKTLPPIPEPPTAQVMRKPSFTRPSWLTHSPLLSNPSSPNAARTNTNTNFSMPRASTTGDSQTGSKSRNAKSLGLFSENDKDLAALGLASDMVHTEGAPEYQAMAFTPLPGMRRGSGGDYVQEGMIKVDREVNVEVRDEKAASAGPLKDMLDTGLGLRREPSPRRDASPSSYGSSRHSSSKESRWSSR